MSEEAEQDGSVPAPQAKSLGLGLTVRAVIIAVLALSMLVPLLLVGQLVQERSSRRSEVIDEISASWGGRQLVSGPFLVIPFQDAVPESEEAPVLSYGVFLPSTLAVEGTVDVETRARGIYEAQLYAADLRLSGAFDAPDFSAIQRAPGAERTVLWDQAVLLLTLSDLPAIAALPTATWDGRALEFAPDTGIARLGRGIQAALPQIAAGSGGAEFDIALAFNGSSALAVAPVGGANEVRIAADWPHPSFAGAFLPRVHEIGADAFSAEWAVASLARGYPQAWRADAADYQYMISETAVWVGLVQPIDVYTLTDRAVKYGILFIGLTFLAVFLIELKSGRPVHLLQYGLIGAALSVFFLLLLSLSEHIGFLPAYVAGGAAVLLAIGWYSAGALGSVRRAVAMAATLAVLYVVLFVVLSLVDYALLVGSLVVFIAVVVAMAGSRNLREPAGAIRTG